MCGAIVCAGCAEISGGLCGLGRAPCLKPGAHMVIEAAECLHHRPRQQTEHDEDERALQIELLKDPQIGSVIKGTGKLRKMRFAFPNRGKSGSSRVLYVDFVLAETIYLIFAYPKNEKDNLTDEERNNIKKMIEKIEQSL